MTTYFHPGHKVLFQHVPCTGGAEFYGVITELYGSHHLGIYPQDGSDVGTRVATALAPSSAFHFVSAHSNPIGPLAPHIGVGTFYRDPVERTLSQHFFSRRQAREKGTPEPSILPAADWPAPDTAGHNVYLRWACRLAGVDLGHKDQVDARAVAIALAVVDRAYFWIGITELFQQSLQLLAHKLKWPRLPRSVPQSHVKSGRPATADLDEHTVAWARHATFYDQILYERARARTEREIAALPSLAPAT